VLDVCSGHGGVSRAIRALGFDSREIDILHGPRWDVRSRRLQAQLARSIRSTEVIAMMCAPPCASFSVAQDRSGKLRDREHPWGLPGLRTEQQARVDEGNSVARAILKLARMAERHRLPWIIENPHSSRFWNLPDIAALRSLPSVSESVVDFCMCGTMWRKRTRFLSGNIEECDLERLRGLRCQGRNGICARTRLPHFRLSGCAPSNKPWTVIAQPYPHRLCSHLAWLLTENARSRFANESYRQLMGNRP